MNSITVNPFEQQIKKLFYEIGYSSSLGLPFSFNLLSSKLNELSQKISIDKET